MAKSYVTQRRVEFRDTDAASMMHFSVFFNYMEQVEHEFLRSLGLSVVTDQAEGMISWPRVSAHCDYRAPCRFEEILDVTLTVADVGNKSVKYAFDFARGKAIIAQGNLVAVCCLFRDDEEPESIEMPADVRELLSQYRC